MPTIYASVASHQTSAPVKGTCCEVLKWTGWTGLESWPPDVTRRGLGLRPYTGTCVEGGLCRGRACTGGGDGPRALYSEVPWIILNAHMWPPCGQSDWLMDRHNWKYYLPTTLLASKNHHNVWSNGTCGCNIPTAAKVHTIYGSTTKLIEFFTMSTEFMYMYAWFSKKHRLIVVLMRKK